MILWVIFDIEGQISAVAKAEGSRTKFGSMLVSVVRDVDPC